MLLKYFIIFLIILITLAALFLLDHLIKKKQATSSGTTWRIITGTLELIIAILAFIWIKEHPTNILIRIGIGILAVAGIGEIIIGLLNSISGLHPISESKSKKEDHRLLHTDKIATSLLAHLKQNLQWLHLVNKYVSIWIVFVSASLVVYFVWALDRGFEISDESYYLLLAIHPSAVKLFISAQHWITSAFWAVAGSILGFRAIGLGLLLLSALILARGSIHAYTTTSVTGPLQRREQVLIIASTLSGALLYGATISFSPCYNLLTAAASYAAMGFILLTIGRLLDWRVNALYLLAGCMLGIAMLSKFTAGVAILCLLITLIALLGSTMKGRVIGIVQIVVGMSICILLITFPYIKTSNVLYEINFGMLVFNQVQSEPTAVRLLRYLRELLNQILWSGMIFVVPIAFLSVFKKSSNISRYTNSAMVVIVLLGCYYLPKAFPFDSSLNRWVGSSAFLSTVLALSLISSVPVWTKDAKAITLTIGLLILPYCAAFGTGNGLHTQIVASLASWGTVIAMLSIAPKSKGSRNSLAIIICAIFVSVIAAQVVVSSLHPYQLQGAIWKQTIPTKIGSIGTVKTDLSTNVFVSDLTAAIQNCNISNDRPYLGFYHMPGVALVIQAIPVFSPWLSNIKQSEVMLSRVNPDFLRSAVIGIRLIKDREMPQLPKQILDFPGGYKQCGEATYPYGNQRIQLWMPYPKSQLNNGKR
jgi:hypothetical protein